MATARLKEFNVIPVNPKVPSAGYRLVGQCFDYPNHRNGTRIETGTVIARNKDKTQFVVEGSHRVWQVEGSAKATRQSSVADVDEFISKTQFREFTVDDNGRAVFSATRKKDDGSAMSPDEAEKAAEDDPATQLLTPEARKAATLTRVVEDDDTSTRTDPTTGDQVPAEPVSQAAPVGATNVPATLSRAQGIAIDDRSGPPATPAVPVATALGRDPPPSPGEKMSEQDREKGISPSITTQSSQSRSTVHAAQPPSAEDGGPGNTSSGGVNVDPANGAASAPVQADVTPDTGSASGETPATSPVPVNPSPATRTHAPGPKGGGPRRS